MQKSILLKSNKEYMYEAVNSTSIIFVASPKESFGRTLRQTDITLPFITTNKYS